MLLYICSAAAVFEPGQKAAEKIKGTSKKRFEKGK